MKHTLRSLVFTIAAAVVAFPIAARAATPAQSYYTVSFAVAGAATVTHRTMLSLGGSEHTASEIAEPYAEKDGTIGHARFGTAVHVAAEPVAAADSIRILIEVSNSRKLGKSPDVGAPAASAYAIRALVTVPRSGGEVTLSEGTSASGSLVVERRENLDAAPFTMKVRVSPESIKR